MKELVAIFEYSNENFKKVVHPEIRKALEDFWVYSYNRYCDRTNYSVWNKEFEASGLAQDSYTEFIRNKQLPIAERLGKIDPIWDFSIDDECNLYGILKEEICKRVGLPPTNINLFIQEKEEP